MLGSKTGITAAFMTMTLMIFLFFLYDVQNQHRLVMKEAFCFPSLHPGIVVSYATQTVYSYQIPLYISCLLPVVYI